jgi:hypothetical protein
MPEQAGARTIVVGRDANLLPVCQIWAEEGHAFRRPRCGLPGLCCAIGDEHLTSLLSPSVHPTMIGVYRTGLHNVYVVLIHA